MASSPESSLGLSIRPATIADREIITEFNRSMALETENLILDPKILADGVLGLLRDSRYGFYLVAELQGSVVGQLCITYEWSDWRNGPVWWIQSVYVSPSNRRQGVFTRLFESVKQLAQKTPGVRGLRLYAHSENHNAMKVYQRLGMTKTHYLVFEQIWPAPDSTQV